MSFRESVFFFFPTYGISVVLFNTRLNSVCDTVGTCNHCSTWWNRR